MYKLNVTSILAIMFCIAFFFIATRQAHKAEDMSIRYSDKILEVAMWESMVTQEHKQELSLLHDSIDYYKTRTVEYQAKASASKAKIKGITADYEALKNKVDSFPHDSSYAYLTSLYPSTEKKQYPFAGEQVHDIHYDIVEGQECEEINKELNFENYYLEESLIASGSMNVKMQSEKELLTKNMELLAIEIATSNQEQQKLKKKLWRNRGIAGVASVVAIVLLL